ncbi:heme ABC transporter ATP-binding protein [Microbacterium sp. cf332]|uniref:heme ABC transporter ATP-binding protein n=1 Tax=Microbacterium sp. cf332 TaxID=1761804 RepID=UPI0008811AEC|nr:heme ABC transporter ATP-binding protein [Microbacterium sp. cf332]SDQ61531.1 iron complex transport system ATP-binding protein [Microbacterium sp. cf332]
MNAVLRARGISVQMAGRRVLDGIDLDLRAGEMLVLVGPNGAGKSTLLAVLAGDRAPVSGSVELDGATLESWPVAERARRRSVLMQSNEVSFPFVAGDVVRMGRAPWRRRPEADRDDAAVAEAIAAGEVERFAARPVTGLSGGERARVAFARAYAQECRIALLDEPTASLDIRHQHRVLDRTRRRAEAGGAAIVVLHDLGLAAAYGDRVALLDGGRLAAVGTPRDVFDPELLSRVYRHPIDVVEGPRGSLIVLADSRPGDAAAAGRSRATDPAGTEPAPTEERIA